MTVKKPGLSLSFFCLSLFQLEVKYSTRITLAPSVSSEECRQIYQTARLVCPSGLATERPLPTATPLDAFPGANSLRRVRPRQSCPGSVQVRENPHDNIYESATGSKLTYTHAHTTPTPLPKLGLPLKTRIDYSYFQFTSK